MAYDDDLREEMIDIQILADPGSDDSFDAEKWAEGAVQAERYERLLALIVVQLARVVERLDKIEGAQ